MCENKAEIIEHMTIKCEELKKKTKDGKEILNETKTDEKSDKKKKKKLKC